MKLDFEEIFVPLEEESAYGIFDTERNCFVRCSGSGKSAWAKAGYAKNAFANAISNAEWRYRHLQSEIKSRFLADNPRFEIRQYSSNETYKYK